MRMCSNCVFWNPMGKLKFAVPNGTALRPEQYIEEELGYAFYETGECHAAVPTRGPGMSEVVFQGRCFSLKMQFPETVENYFCATHKTHEEFHGKETSRHS